jgi:phosphopantetheinyl transferase (holo-ACP synthase)
MIWPVADLRRSSETSQETEQDFARRIVSEAPEEQRAMYKTQIDQTRKAWVDMAKNASVKATLETTCKQTMDATKASLTAFGCSF